MRLIVNVGDFFHVDNLDNETRLSKNKLDVDTRYALMIRAGVRMLRALIETALAKYQLVRVVNAQGNHDENVGALAGQYWPSVSSTKRTRALSSTRALRSSGITATARS